MERLKSENCVFRRMLTPAFAQGSRVAHVP
jgi:hypothetical protein